MGLFESLGGLSPMKRAGAATSRAFRRLLGRRLPAGDDDVTTDTTAAATATPAPPPSTQPISSTTTTIAASYQCQQIQQSNATGKVQAQPSNTSTDKREDTQRDSCDSIPEPANTSANATMAACERHRQLNKENQLPSLKDLTDTVNRFSLSENVPSPRKKPAQPAMPVFQDPVVVAERAMHMRFIEEALDMARLALRTNETPVGCVLVHEGKVIAKGMNATNVTRNGTRHAEFMAISALLSFPPKNGPRATCLKPFVKADSSSDDSDDCSEYSKPPNEGNEDGSKSHLFPYGQKLHPDPRVDRRILSKCTLYVTVEPCVMCASLLRQLGIRKVYFGAVNDKFGGTGGVFSIHANSLPISGDGPSPSSHPMPKPTQLPDGSGCLGTSFPPGGGDGGNLEPGYEIEGGWGRDEAVSLLRRFYVQENGRAPMPRKKEGRAARLAAMMERDGDASATSAIISVASDAETDLKVTSSNSALVEVSS